MATMSSSLIRALICALFLVFAEPCDAFLRHLCFNPLGVARIDPLVSFGKPSQHAHHLHGANNLGLNTIDADVLLASACTSCSITVDKSAYWAPAMYFQHDNGTFSLLSTASGITIYYKLEKRANHLNANYSVFPKGFRMIAGTNDKRSWVGPWPVPDQSSWGANDTSQKALAEKAIGFNCLNYNHADAEPSLAYPYLRDKGFTDTHCADGMRAELLFPSCWDGVNLNSPDHKSHVVYPTLIQDGDCPDTHPIFLPVLFYETIWNTQEFAGMPGKYVFANGDPTGFGYHGDFIAAWEDSVLQRITDDPTCTDHDLANRKTNGIQEECMAIRDSLQSPAQAAQCKLQVPNQLKSEKVSGLLENLPNHIEVSGTRHNPGDGNHTFPSEGDESSAAQAPSASTNPSLPTPAPLTATAQAVPSVSKTATAPEQTASFIILSTSTYIENHVKYEIVMAETIVTKTVTLTSAIPSVRSHQHSHKHGHGYGHA